MSDLPHVVGETHEHEVDPGCICSRCGPPWRDHLPKPAPGTVGEISWGSWMALCPTCGNKRCPGAGDHHNTCTGSNEAGQAGSNYADLPVRRTNPFHLED